MTRERLPNRRESSNNRIVHVMPEGGEFVPVDVNEWRAQRVKDGE